MLLTIQSSAARRVALLVAGEAEADRRVDDQPEQPHRRPDEQRRERARAVQALHEHAEEEHGEDRRPDVGRHALQVLVEAARALDHRDPGEADQHHHDGRDAADPHQLRLRRAGPELRVEVDREERRAGVEHAGERAHEGGEQPGDDDAAHAGRQDVAHHQRERRLRRRRHHLAGRRIDEHRQARALAGLGQRQRDHARDDEDEDRQQLEEGREDGAATGLRLVGRAERALHDVLVGAPVPEADDRRAEQHAQPRVVAVEVPRDAAGFLHRRPRAFEAGRHQRLPQVEHLRPEHRPQLAPAAEDVETVDGQHQRADHEDQRLDRFGVGDGAHPAEHRVDAGQDDDQHRPDPEAVQHDAAELQLHAGQQRAEDDAAREDADRDLGDHVGDQRDQRQDPARRRREAPLEELRHRVDARPDVERHQHPAEHQQAPRVQLVVRERDAAGGAGAGQADEVLRADVGGEDRRADHEPAEVAAGQEVVVGGVPVRCG